MSNCPRCQGDQTRVEHEGVEDGQTVWTVYYCEACCFTWRDTEPAESIDASVRPKIFRVDPSEAERYPVIIPPRET